MKLANRGRKDGTKKMRTKEGKPKNTGKTRGRGIERREGRKKKTGKQREKKGRKKKTEKRSKMEEIRQKIHLFKVLEVCSSETSVYIYIYTRLCM
jgi:hypothetical protein